MEIPVLLSSVAIIWLIAVVTPGPNFFITVQTAIGRSQAAALSVVWGIGLGTLIWAVSAYLGLHVLFRTAPWVYLFLKWVGGGYLVYLGVRLLFFGSAPRSAGNGSRSEKKYGRLQNFKLGLLTNLSNPKTAAFMASLFAATMPGDASWFLGTASIALVFAISMAWYTAVAYLFSRNWCKKAYDGARTWIERLAGVVFVGFGARLATGE